MPPLRHGDLLFNAIVLRHRSENRAAERRALADARGCFGKLQHPTLASPTESHPKLFEHSDLRLELLFSHTVVGVYGRAASPRCLSECLALHPKQALPRLFRSLHLSPSAYLRLCSSTLRSCGQCIQEDIENRGFTTWRVLHQVSAIDRCPYHRHSLVPELAPQEGSKRLWPLALPGEQDFWRASHHSEAIQISEGYADYLALWIRLFKGELPIIQPEYWLDVVTCILRRRSIDAAERRLRLHIERTWGCSLTEIAGRLKLGNAASLIKGELWLKSVSTDIARRLLIYSAATKCGLVNDEQVRLSLAHGPREIRMAEALEPACVNELRLNVLSNGLPLASCGALLKFKRSELAAGAAGLEIETLRRHIRDLPTELLHQIFARFQELQGQSWLTTELRRRSSPERRAAA